MSAAPKRANLRPPQPPRILHFVEDKPERTSWLDKVCQMIDAHASEQYQKAGELRDWGRK